MADRSCRSIFSSPLCGFAIGALLLIYAIADIYVITVAGSNPDDVPTVRCRLEDTLSWETRSSLHSDGTTCSYQCPANCTCSLGAKVVTSNCSDGNISTSQYHYPSLTYHLRWAHGTVHTIGKDAFRNVAGSVWYLYLDYMGLVNLQPGAFSGMRWSLTELYLRHNMLDAIKCGVFDQLIWLRDLDLSDNILKTIQPGAFQGLTSLTGLDLSNNLFSSNDINPDAFEGLTQLLALNLNDNLLNETTPRMFEVLAQLVAIHLGGNMLNEIDTSTFGVLPELSLLYYANNMLRHVNADVLTELKGLKTLALSNNVLDEIPPGTLGAIINLVVLALDNNQIVFLHGDTFENQSRLMWLDMSHNRLHRLSDGLFQNLVMLSHLGIAGNELSQLYSRVFQNCVNLVTLNLTQNNLQWITTEVFNDLNESTLVYVDQYATCCFVTAAECKYSTFGSEFLTCKRLLPYSVLRTGIWIVSLATLLGNILVLYTRCKTIEQRNKVQFVLITNLSISDLLMGIYLMVLLFADLHFTDYFPSHSESWRSSILCKTVGALSVLSSEASVFFITLISIDRFLGIRYPFSRHRLGTKSAKIAVSLIWMLAFFISLTCLILGEIDTDLYPISEICVGLPISRRTMYETNVTSAMQTSYLSSIRVMKIATEIKHEVAGSKAGMYFSIAIFTGLNLLCFLVVGTCYLLIFISVRQSAKRSSRSIDTNEEIRMAKKMSLIVLTDFCCWVPLGVMSILVQSGAVTIDPVGYAWIATFILPFNSSINPFLYTFASKISDKRFCTKCRITSVRSEGTNIQMVPTSK